MAGRLYPAYQKFYNAITSLERFKNDNCFFDNIACLDSFFSEYRNITFAIQKELAHTELLSEYERLRDIYLTDHWFVDKRNETVKQRPFNLLKTLDITVYSPSDSFALKRDSFTVENDTPLESLLGEVKSYLDCVTQTEVFFSVRYRFSEADTGIDLWAKLEQGLQAMKCFMDEMYLAVDDGCQLCSQIREKIEESFRAFSIHDIQTVDDYVYYPVTETFDRAMIVEGRGCTGGNQLVSRQPLSVLSESRACNYDGTAFGTFVLMNTLALHAAQGGDLMPAFLIVYEDDTFDMGIFHSTIKTTMYRKITEFAQRVEIEEIRQVCLMLTYSTIPYSESLMKKTHAERLAESTEDHLVFMSVDAGLEQLEYAFQCARASDLRYIAETMHRGCSHQLVFGKANMLPIVKAFEDKATR
jgi:hypothetical protein